MAAEALTPPSWSLKAALQGDRGAAITPAVRRLLCYKEGMRSFGELWRASQRPPSPRWHLVLLVVCLLLIGFTIYRYVAGHSGAAITLIPEIALLARLALSYRNTRQRDKRSPLTGHNDWP